MLRETIAFKLNLSGGSKIISNNATFFHGTMHLYATSRDHRIPRLFVNFRGVECKTPAGDPPDRRMWENTMETYNSHRALLALIIVIVVIKIKVIVNRR